MKFKLLLIALALSIFICGFFAHSLLYSPSYNYLPISFNASSVFLDSSGYIPQEQNITTKYLDDVGLVVKWTEGAILTDNTSSLCQWIQRFEPWLNERTRITYNVTWESK